MPLTEQQSIPSRTETKEPWTIRKLLSSGQVVSTISKTFTNPFDVLLGFMILVAGVGELLGHQVSWFFWAFAALILAADFEERHKSPITEEIKTKEIKK